MKQLGLSKGTTGTLPPLFDRYMSTAARKFACRCRTVSRRHGMDPTAANAANRNYCRLPAEPEKKGRKTRGNLAGRKSGREKPGRKEEERL